MKKKLENLYNLYLNLEEQLKEELDKLGQDECNCDDQEEINYTDYEGDDIRVITRCGNCGGVIWNREI